jgi:hypothetical protein
VFNEYEFLYSGVVDDKELRLIPIISEAAIGIVFIYSCVMPIVLCESMNMEKPGWRLIEERCARTLNTWSLRNLGKKYFFNRVAVRS